MSGGEVAVGMVDEMPEASELGPANVGGRPVEEGLGKATGGGVLPMVVVNDGEEASRRTAAMAPTTMEGESSNLSSLAATNQQQKPNV